MDTGMGMGEKAVLGGAGLLAASRFLDGWSVAICAAVFGALFFVLQTWKQGYWARQGIPSPPDASLLFGHLAKLRKEGRHNIEPGWIKSHGKVVGFYTMGCEPDLLVADVDMLRHIFVKDFANFQNRRVRNTKTAVGALSRMVMSKFMTNLRDQRWKEVRNTVSPAFTSGKMKLMVPILRECAETLCQVLDERIQAGDSDFPVKPVMGNLTMEVIAKTAFAMDSNAQRDEKDPFVEAVAAMFNFSFKSVGAIMFMGFTKTTVLLNKWLGYVPMNKKEEQFFTDAIAKVIKERRRDPGAKRSDFLQLLLSKSEISDEDRVGDAEFLHDLGHSSVSLSVQEITAQSMLFLFAGYETTAITLHFLLYLLAVNPEVQQRCAEEMAEVMGESEDGELSYDASLRLHYLEACVAETLRLFPPASGTERYTERDCEVFGVKIAAGTTIGIPIYAIHHSEEHYEEPEKFDPSRFLGEAKKKRDPLTYLPFGYGPRNCIGMRFAQMEIRLTMAKLLTKFHFVATSATEAYPPKLKITGLICPASPIRIGVERREQ